jgi:hypothetical protein
MTVITVYIYIYICTHIFLKACHVLNIVPKYLAYSHLMFIKLNNLLLLFIFEKLGNFGSCRLIFWQVELGFESRGLMMRLMVVIPQFPSDTQPSCPTQSSLPL